MQRLPQRYSSGDPDLSAPPRVRHPRSRDRVLARRRARRCARVDEVRATPETPFNIFSAAKAITAMVVHLLDQRHLIHLDDPICEYIPEFGTHGKQWITIRHVLTHRSGFPTFRPTRWISIC
jgi:CubicO group peptidase (beta-lactamase class C family)